MPIRLRSLLVAVGLSVTTAGAQNPTTVPVFLPGYGPGDWEALRGSIIASNDKATTYTLFCVEQTPPSCVLDTDLPLSFAEGPDTLRFDGTKSGQITAHLSCNLEGSTAATCTGSSTYGTGFREGSITGPTQTVWTKTLTGNEIKWGVLTLTTPPAQAATTNLDDPTPVDSATVTAQTSAPTVSSSGRRSFIPSQGMGWIRLAVSVGTLALLL
ncbi:hypothetical protein CONLIGDRAFT_641952 [Coniochaeta ligniaria NRRL 30616]|uniref:Uncharacterized protein n=1 Tax=Coniochaeta ligniaria NRRL 30616 TaxID=1408157 RepID=A0A1J7IY46_9PEZI|nr:hypothetical protein CONLIGDRAFT_641952 [Coniochaeta ligniaria NRRL 30616]